MNESISNEQIQIELTPEDLSALFNYPNLGKIFETATDLEKMRNKLNFTYADLERVIRQGSKDDAEKATKAANAIKITLNLLETIEKIKTEQP